MGTAYRSGWTGTIGKSSLRVEGERAVTLILPFGLQKMARCPLPSLALIALIMSSYLSTLIRYLPFPPRSPRPNYKIGSYSRYISRCTGSRPLLSQSSAQRVNDALGLTQRVPARSGIRPYAQCVSPGPGSGVLKQDSDANSVRGNVCALECGEDEYPSDLRTQILRGRADQPDYTCQRAA